jgi:DNA-binding transcriptional regulator GbsR (MarR family)
MLGRVLGVLLISDPPERSAEELANLLRASRGSISQATRTLVQMGMVRRLTRPGERRDYFRVVPNAWEETTRQEMAQISVFQDMAERGLALLTPDEPEARRRLEEMRDFYAYLRKELPALLERWEKEREEP